MFFIKACQSYSIFSKIDAVTFLRCIANITNVCNNCDCYISAIDYVFLYFFLRFLINVSNIFK